MGNSLEYIVHSYNGVSFRTHLEHYARPEHYDKRYDPLRFSYDGVKCLFFLQQKKLVITEVPKIQYRRLVEIYADMVKIAQANNITVECLPNLAPIIQKLAHPFIARIQPAR